MSGSIGGPVANTTSQFPIPGQQGGIPTQGFQMPQMGNSQGPPPMQAQLPPWAMGGAQPNPNLAMFGHAAQVPVQAPQIQGMGQPPPQQGVGQPGQPGVTGNNPYLAGLAPLLQALMAQQAQGGGQSPFAGVPPVQPQPFNPPTLPQQAAPQTTVPGLGAPLPPGPAPGDAQTFFGPATGPQTGPPSDLSGFANGSGGA